MISTAVANYVLHTNCCRRHWILALGSFNILLYIVLIQLFAARTNKPLLLLLLLFSGMCVCEAVFRDGDLGGGACECSRQRR